MSDDELAAAIDHAEKMRDEWSQRATALRAEHRKRADQKRDDVLSAFVERLRSAPNSMLFEMPPDATGAALHARNVHVVSYRLRVVLSTKEPVDASTFTVQCTGLWCPVYDNAARSRMDAIEAAIPFPLTLSVTAHNNGCNVATPHVDLPTLRYFPDDIATLVVTMLD